MPGHHINSKGIVAKCTAKTSETCTANPPFGLKQIHDADKNTVSEQLVKQYAERFDNGNETITKETAKKAVKAVKPASTKKPDPNFNPADKTKYDANTKKIRGEINDEWESIKRGIEELSKRVEKADPKSGIDNFIKYRQRLQLRETVLLNKQQELNEYEASRDRLERRIKSAENSKKSDPETIATRQEELKDFDTKTFETWYKEKIEKEAARRAAYSSGCGGGGRRGC